MLLFVIFCYDKAGFIRNQKINTNVLFVPSHILHVVVKILLKSVNIWLCFIKKNLWNVDGTVIGIKFQFLAIFSANVLTLWFGIEIPL